MSLKETREFKGRRSESDRGAAERRAGCTSKRLKSTRASSPTLSYMSMRTDWSMDPPANFKDGETFPLHLRVRAASPSPTMRTDWSMDPPANFKSGEMNARLWGEHHLKCPLCKSMLKDPVSITCGHRFCRDCINVWDDCAGDFVCPQCDRTSETHPVLNTNLQKTFSPASPPLSYAGPDDVACDFCTENRLKAVKSCSTCGVFLCETHIRQHYTIPALQKHSLRDVTTENQMKMKLLLEQQKTVNIFSSVTSGQQNLTDKTQDPIKEIAVKSLFESFLKNATLQKRPKKFTKTSRPRARDNKDVRRLTRVCSTLQQDISGLKKSISKFSKVKHTKKANNYEEESGEDEDDDDDGDSDERSDDEESYEDHSDEEQEGSENSCDEEEDEDSREDEEDDSEYSDDEGTDDERSESSEDRSSDDYCTEDDEEDY
ncbi:MATH and LRR domain-containing protein PFE0570w isoform X2 [Danio aesculapii]|uniref:MATH and LRR domain-containing protein PFE0570w isoform X2 n=1 Tax=Danio aesculapii TaxID=1142201 RepID=UPI0024BFDCC7|nr:MATH and LRR domain-containing protein PFE0570w isoform X2 [Danio aesculapii]